MGKRHALLVATTRYADPKLPGLLAPVPNAQRLARLLRNPDVGGFDTARVLLDQRKAVVEYEIEKLLRHVAPDDLVLLYLLGHGLHNSENQLFFAASDTECDSPYATAVPAMLVRHLLHETRAGNKAVLLDCRFNRMSYRTSQSPDTVDLRTALGPSTYVISATNQLHGVQDIVQPSSFTHDLVTVLDTGAAARPGSTTVTANDLYDHLCRQAEGQWPTRHHEPLGSFTIAYRPQAFEVPTRPDVVGPPGSLRDVLGVPDDSMTLDLRHAWRPRPLGQRLRVPIGVDDDGGPVELDLKGPVQEGMGPHGLCVGEGKADFLRTLLLSLAITHSPTAVNFLLVAGKGDEAFRGFDQLPHVAGLITNLGDDLAMADRLTGVVAGELNRRQQAVKSYRNAMYYEQARENGADLEPMPSLLIVLDEYNDLLAAKPNLVEMLITVVRLGKTLNVHLLLTAHRFDQFRLRDLDQFFSWRVALKTSHAVESRGFLGIPDAHELPVTPRTGYLKYGRDVLVRFTARASVPSAQDVIVSRLAGQGPPANQVWLPPLDKSAVLGALLPPLAPDDHRGLSPVGFAGNGTLRTPVGVVDLPFEHRFDVLWADFSGETGHAAVVGGGRSGKTTLLTTLMLSMALTHTPKEAQFYCLDFGGGTLADLRGLPHVCAVAGHSGMAMARELVTRIRGLLAARQQRFRDLGINSIADFRHRKRQDLLTADLFGDVFLVVDGWAELLRKLPDLETQVVTLAAEGLAYGVHVIVAAERWTEIPWSLKDLLGSRFELRLDDPSESHVDHLPAANVPRNRPGRGLTRDKMHFLAAVPRIDGSNDRYEVLDGVRDTVARITAAWRGPSAPRIPLPTSLPYEHLLAHASSFGRQTVPIGVGEAEWAPAFYNFSFGQTPSFLAFGDRRSGRTNLLRTIIRGIVDRNTREEAVILLVDFRQTLHGFVDADHLLGYASDRTQLAGLVEDVCALMRRRLPGPDFDHVKLRMRSWWRGPEVFVIVDDFEHVEVDNPFAPLVEFVEHAEHIGLHFVIARGTAGAASGTHDGLLAALRKTPVSGIVMNGDKHEGALIGGVAPSVLPPGRGTLVHTTGDQRLVQIALAKENPPARRTPTPGTP